MSHPLHVPPTLEGRALVELGATLARLRRDHDAALDRIDALEAQLRAAQDALAHRTPDETLWTKA